MKQSVAIVGNPNCGKTTLFNGLTGSNQHIGNWPGVTVEKKAGILLGTKDIEIIDLPGIYALNASSEDELITKNHLLNSSIQLVVNIADASNLERNLFLTITLLEMGKPVLLVLNMIDMAEKCGIAIDIEKLSEDLGIPVMGINALNGANIRDVRRKIQECLKKPSPTVSPVKYPSSIESVLAEWEPLLSPYPRQMAVLLLEEDEEVIDSAIASGALHRNDIQDKIALVQNTECNDPDIVIAETKFACITEMLKKSLREKRILLVATEIIDKVVLNKWAGIPIFLMVMYVIFWIVTEVGGIFINFFDIIFGAIFVDGVEFLLESIASPNWLIIILAKSIGTGIQTIATFIPIVFLMFFMLSILEDSGYMVRVSFVMDRMMQKLGLPGKAFVPMLIGFGCTVPAIMATRTLDNTKDRCLTIFMTPFMSCSARLPVYALFGTAFFGNYAGIMIYALYIVGIVMAILTGLLLKGTLFNGKVTHLVMELPPYHTPHLGTILNRVWNRLRIFIFQAGKLIILAVLILSLFNYLGTNGEFGNPDSQSVLEFMGKALTPVFQPMGVEEENWPAVVGLLTGLFAKEAIVGTISGIYGQMNAMNKRDSLHSPGSETTFSLWNTIRTAFVSISINSKGVFSTFLNPLKISPTSDLDNIPGETHIQISTLEHLRISFKDDWIRAFAYLLFVLLYFPCIAAFSTILREIGQLYGWLAVIYLTILAWSTATLFYQIASEGSFLWIACSIIFVFLFIPIFNLISGRWKLPKRMPVFKD